MKYKTEGLNELSQQFHQFQIAAGFTDSNIVQRLMLVHSEISEAFEAFRKDKRAKKPIVELSFHPKDQDRLASLWKVAFEQQIKDTLEDEIADSIIRLLAFAAENHIDIEKHIESKMTYNELRGFKFGGKKF